MAERHPQHQQRGGGNGQRERTGAGTDVGDDRWTPAEQVEPPPVDELKRLSFDELLNVEVTSVSRREEALRDSAAAVAEVEHARHPTSPEMDPMGRIGPTEIIIVAVLIMAATRPSDYRVERTVLLKAPPGICIRWKARTSRPVSLSV